MAFSPSCAKVAVQKEAEQMYAIGEGFFSIVISYLLWLKVIKIQVGNKELIAAFYVNI